MPALLASEWDLKGPPGILDVGEIAAALPAAFILPNEGGLGP